MLVDRPDEQETLFKEIVYKKISVRDAELIARRIAVEKARKKEINFDPEIADLEKKFAESLGTRVHIEKGQNGGIIKIDFFSNNDIKAILSLINSPKVRKVDELLDKHIAEAGSVEAQPKLSEEEAIELDDDPKAKNEEGEDLYSVKNFSLYLLPFLFFLMFFQRVVNMPFCHICFHHLEPFSRGFARFFSYNFNNIAVI